MKFLILQILVAVAAFPAEGDIPGWIGNSEACTSKLMLAVELPKNRLSLCTDEPSTPSCSWQRPSWASEFQ